MYTRYTPYSEYIHLLIHLYTPYNTLYTPLHHYTTAPLHRCTGTGGGTGDGVTGLIGTPLFVALFRSLLEPERMGLGVEASNLHDLDTAQRYVESRLLASYTPSLPYVHTYVHPLYMYIHL